MNQNLTEEQKADYQTFEATGSHYQIGVQTARHAGETIGPSTCWTAKMAEFGSPVQQAGRDGAPIDG